MCVRAGEAWKRGRGGVSRAGIKYGWEGSEGGKMSGFVCGGAVKESHGPYVFAARERMGWGGRREGGQEAPRGGSDRGTFWGW